MMGTERLSRASLDIFDTVLSGELSSGRIADRIGRSPSYASECIGRLRDMGLVETRQKGLSVLVRPSQGQLASALALLLKEGSGLDVAKVLTGPGLAILPHLLPPGSTARELVRASSLSQMTVMERIRLWRAMGIVVRDRGTGLYRLAPGQRGLSEFASRYSEDRHRRSLAKALPGAILLWRGKTGFLFSVDAGTPVRGFAPAGPTALAALGQPIVHSRDYYIGGRARRSRSLDEALVQTMLIDPGNPRIRRMIRERAASSTAARNGLRAFGQAYGITSELDRILEDGHAGQKVRTR